MKILTIANQKGGCGKTTTSVNLAAALAKRDKSVLLIDLDPQGHSTLGVGHNPDSFSATIYNVMSNPEVSISSVIVGTSIQRLNLVPNNILLSGADIKLASIYEREFILRNKLNDLNDVYDFCVIDCSPSLNLMTLNALVACSDVIIPVQTQYYALEGLRQLLETINIVSERYNPDIGIMGILMTFVEGNTTLSKQVQQQMRNYFGDLIFDTVIHRTVKLAEAPSAGESIITYAPTSKGAIEYKSLAEEILHGKAQDRTAQGDFGNLQRCAVAE